ncbi:MAG: Uma2 family endonuclease [Eubacterium sp.]|nr:Uma2 family endonuclease [Eubacterium sp.]
MTIEEMISKKKEMGFSNKQVAEFSGVPLGTVQKIFSGSTETPRYQTLQALSKVFEKRCVTYFDREDHGLSDDEYVREGKSYTPGTSATKIKHKTLDDYMALPEGTRIELIDGIFYEMSAPTFVHQRIGAMIFNVFENFINKNGGPCITSVAPTDVQLDCDDKTIVQPDVLVVCDRDKIIKARVVGAPDLVIEVLSPSNWYMDTFRKMNKYKNAGVREYWIVVPDEKKVIVYNFEKSSEFIEYTFDDKVPVAIWDNKCEVDFKEIYDKISFLYD